jgi:zinc dependent phospholipase C
MHGRLATPTTPGRALLVAAIVSLPMGAWTPEELVQPARGDALRLAALWKPNSHIFAANLAREDAIDDGLVTIPPYGAIPANPDAVRALRKFPNDFRGGVIGPDVFPDILVGQSFAHVDHSSNHNRWTADDWLRHLFRQARAWRDPAADPDRVLAFAYGWLTHAAGDMFGHSYVNDWGDGRKGGAEYAWDWGNPIIVGRHVALESYIAQRTPPTDTAIDVWARFMAEAAIKHASVVGHTADAVHYQHWMKMYHWLGPALARAKAEMDAAAPNKSYATKCAAAPAACASKEFFETWYRDIDGGLHKLVEANLVLGRGILNHRVQDGISAISEWNGEWLMKMHGAHAPAEVLKWIADHDPLAPVKDSIRALVVDYMEQRFARQFALLKMMSSPAYYMDSVYKPNGPAVRAAVDADMHLGADGLLRWREFEPLYNTVITSKLVLLDGTGLNELARRAGIGVPLYPDGANIMFAFMKSMDGHRQWEGGEFGFAYKPYDAKSSSARAAGMSTAGGLIGLPMSGFPFWGDPIAREKIFARIFKGYGPGPGLTLPTDALEGRVPKMKDTMTTAPPVSPTRRKP